MSTEHANIPDFTTPKPEGNPMADLFAKHGGESVLDAITASNPGASDQPPAEKPESASTPKPEPKPEADQEDAGEDLDAATLEALGLTPKDEETPSGDEADEGTPQSKIDPTLLAQTLGLEADDLVMDENGLRVKTKIDGEEGTVSLADLRKGYQKDRSLTQRTEAFLKQREDWEQARQQEQQNAQTLAQLATEVLNAEEQALNQQYTRDWKQLRQDDPAEYAAQVAEYNQRLQQLRGRQQQLAADLQQKQQKQQEEMAKKLQEAGVEGRKRMAETFGWKTTEEVVSGLTKTRDYLVNTVGIPPNEVNHIYDPRVLISTEKARLYDEMMVKVEAARTKLKETKEKTPRATSARGVGHSKMQRKTQAQERLAQTGTVEAAAGVFEVLGIDNL